MKTSILICLLSLFVSMTFAQRPGGPPMRNLNANQIAQKQGEQMRQSLELSEGQWTLVDSLNLKYAEKMVELRASAPEDRNQMRSLVESLNAEKNQEMKAILDKKQFKAYKAFQEEQRAKMQEMRRN